MRKNSRAKNTLRFVSVNMLYKYIKKSGLLHNDKPELILIGGCARSGKSTLARCLAHKLRDGKTQVCIIAIDSWLVSLEKRKAGSTVMERYESKRIVKAIKDVLEGKTVYPSVYDARLRRRIAQTALHGIAVKKGVVILEGVIALALTELLRLASLRIFVCAPDSVRLNRLKYFYQRIKKVGLGETKKIIDAREIEEVPFIKNSLKNADLVFGS